MATALAVDGTSLLGHRTGVGAFTHEVVTRLARREDIDLTLFAVTWRGRGELHDLGDLVSPGTRVINRPMAARPLRRLWRRLDLPPIEWWTGSIDVVHGPNFVVPPARRAGMVVTVHDLTCLHFPDLCTADTLEYPALIRRAIARGAWVHTVSPFVADEVREAFAIDADRVVAISNGTSGPADPRGDEHAPATPEQGHRLAGGDRYILGLGTIEPRKDFPSLVRAFDVLAADDPDLRLVIAGPDGWGLDAFTASVADARHRDRIVRLHWIPDAERTALLRGASVFAFPSIYEGFGLPPLEAMAAGTPVVATRAGALPDTVGDAAVLVPVGDVEALAGALGHVLHDDAQAAELVRRGARNLARFSWDRTTDALVELYGRANANH